MRDPFLFIHTLVGFVHQFFEIVFVAVGYGITNRDGDFISL